ncbi:MAG: efflux RND transporter permease subunit, partial [bacterium]
MESLFRFFSERHILANLFTGGVIIFGLATLTFINRAQYPTVDFGRLFITAYYPGASAEEVELNVTNKIEEELKSVTDIKETTSISMENSSFMEVTIVPNVQDLDEVQDEIREAVARVPDFPPEVTEAPLVTELKTSIFPIIEVGLSGNLPYPVLREHARLFEKKLKNIKGVARVKRYGYRAREIKVEVSPALMNWYQLPLHEIIMAIRARTMSAHGGSIESYANEKKVVMLNEFSNPLEVGNVIVRSTFEGKNIKVKDLAIVKDDFEEERIMSRMARKPAISFVVLKSERADVIRTVDAIKKLVEVERKNLPDEVEILYSNDVSKYVRNKFNIVFSNGVMGLVLVVLMLALFLNLRTAFWVALSIPVVMFGVIFLLPVFGTYLDGITLSAMILVLGIIVDDGIIISENIYRRRELGDSPQDAAFHGIQEVFQPVLTTILTTFMAFAPMFFMPGLMGKFIYVIPLTVSLALFISLVEIVVALPAHLVPGMQKLKAKSARSSGRNWFEPLRNSFERMSFHLLRGRYLLILMAIVVLAGSLWYAQNAIPFILFPTKGAEQFFITLELPTGTSLQATSDQAKKVEELISELPKDEVDSFVTRIGRYGDMVDIESENYAFIYVNLTPFSEREKTADEIVEGLRRQIDDLDVFRSTSFFIEAGGPRVGKPVVVRVVGSDDDLRKTLADSVYAFLQTIAGVKEIERDDKIGKKQVDIKPNYGKLARLGLTAADIAQTVKIAYDGQIVTSVRYGEEDVNFRVVLQEKARKRLSYLRKLTIPNRQGRLIPLKDVARLKILPGPAEFRHYEGERSTTISADLFQRQTTALAAVQQVLDHFKLDKEYPGMQLIIGGKAQEQQESLAGLLLTFGLAIIGIYFLLVLLFNSMTMPLMVLVAVPFGMIGVIWAFVLHGEAFSFLGLLGAVGLVGVVVNDSLVLVSHVNQLRKDNPNQGIRKIVAEGTADRLRAIIMTTFTTVAGLVPLVYGLGGQDAYMSPMALALGYGLLFSTPLTLVLVPCLYVVGYDL